MTEFQPGDIFACYGGDWTSRWITFRTSAPWTPFRRKHAPSHVAMAVPDSGERLLWVESTTMARTRACWINNEPINGCQAHIPEGRIRDYLTAGGRVDLYRLAPVDQLGAHQIIDLRHYLIDQFVKKRVRYDLVGAVLSGPALTARYARTGLQRAFCSELLAGALMHLGKLTRRNPGHYSPARLMRKLVSDTTYYRVAEFDGPRASRDVIQLPKREAEIVRSFSPFTAKELRHA